MTHYEISKEELEAFAKKVYEEACYGYLDLKDSVCDGMIRDFLDGRKILPPIDTNIMTIVGSSGLTPPRSTANSLTPPRSDGPPDPGPVQHDFEWDITTDSINDIPVPTSLATGLDSPHENRDIQMRATSGHQIELVDHLDQVRPETNFEGNESERF